MMLRTRAVTIERLVTAYRFNEAAAMMLRTPLGVGLERYKKWGFNEAAAMMLRTQRLADRRLLV